MRDFKQGFYVIFATYRNLKDCKSKHFFELECKFIKSYHFFKLVIPGHFPVKAIFYQLTLKTDYNQ